jgi:hypothetical protein
MKGGAWFVFASALGMFSNLAPAQELNLLSTRAAERQIRELHAGSRAAPGAEASLR